MSANSNVVRSESGATPEATSHGTTVNKLVTVFKGALIVGAVLFVTITWALQAAAQFN